MGKSAAGDWLERRGLPVVDSDVVAREVCAPGTAALAEIRNRFGPDVIGPDGGLLRDQMARMIFGDESSRKALEAILHPKIRASWKAEAKRWRDAGRVAGVVQIPLLFETAAENEFDAIICLACSGAIQKDRLMKRGWDEAQIARRIASQIPIGEKIDRSDFVVWNESGLNELGEQLDRILRELGVTAN